MRPGEKTLRLLLEPIARWLDDPCVTEICVNRPGEVWVERLGMWLCEQVPELDFVTLDSIATLAAAMTSQDVGPDIPLCATMLPDGQRVQICRPPAVAPTLISITIRRPASFHPTVAGLAEGGLFRIRPEQWALADRLTAKYGEHAEFLPAAVAARKNILIAGRTGSGKTTLARALIDAIALEERLVTIEDTPEWEGLPHRNRVALYYSKGDQGMARVSSEDLLVASLRLRPDRVLMQELRDGAAFSYLRGVVAGHPGSITTLHAGSALAAFDALRLMVRQNPAGATLADADVRDLLKGFVDVVVHCERHANDFSVTEVYWKEEPHADLA
jgi:type IV secretion system protein VirB11